MLVNVVFKSLIFIDLKSSHNLLACIELLLYSRTNDMNKLLQTSTFSAEAY